MRSCEAAVALPVLNKQLSYVSFVHALYSSCDPSTTDLSVTEHVNLHLSHSMPCICAPSCQARMQGLYMRHAYHLDMPHEQQI